MTVQKTFEFNVIPGVMRILRPDGSVGFDSRRQTFRIYMTGTANVNGRTYDSLPGLHNLGVQQVLYGKTFAKAPYVRTISKRIGFDPINPDSLNPSDADQPYTSQFWIDNYQPSRTTTSATGPFAKYNGANAGAVGNTTPSGSNGYLRGHGSIAYTTSLYLQNFDSSASGNYVGTRQFWYAIFENPVDGS